MASDAVKPWGSLNWPNRISIVRLLLVAPFVVMIMNHQQWGAPARYVALGVFVSMAVSDALDGMMARRMGSRSRLGAILDPLADKVMIICAAVLLSLPESQVREAPLPNWVVVAIVGKDLWVITGFVVVYLVTDRFRVRPTRAGKVCTVAQILLVGLTLVSPDLNWVYPNMGTVIAAAMGWIVAATSLVAAVGYTVLGLTFIAAEEKPLEDAARNARSAAQAKRSNGPS